MQQDEPRQITLQVSAGTGD